MLLQKCSKVPFMPGASGQPLERGGGLYLRGVSVMFCNYEEKSVAH